MNLKSLDKSDPRQVEVNVAGPAALIVAKMHKIYERISEREQPGRRRIDKDAADVIRLMQATQAGHVALSVKQLMANSLTHDVTAQAINQLDPLFGSVRGEGVRMAVRALEIAMPAERVEQLSRIYVRQLLDSLENTMQLR